MPFVFSPHPRRAYLMKKTATKKHLRSRLPEAAGNNQRRTSIPAGSTNEFVYRHYRRGTRGCTGQRIPANSLPAGETCCHSIAKEEGQ